MLLLRGATRKSSRPSSSSPFQYMLLLRGATRQPRSRHRQNGVSIHAPLARSNLHGCTVCRTGRCFNTCSSCEEQPHALPRPHARRRFNTCSSCEEQQIFFVFRFFKFRFQYMLLLRGATRTFKPCCFAHTFQYMLLARGATFPRLRHSGDGHVSIHAPLARSNLFVDIPDPATAVSIHAPLARSNGDDAIALEWTNVSIHAPLARSNASLHPRSPPAGCFNTCSSCEEQLAAAGAGTQIQTFQYMLLLRGATCSSSRISASLSFQYMLLLRGATRSDRVPAPRSRRFNTCSSCEEQRLRRWRLLQNRRFNTCSSCEEQLRWTVVMVVKRLVSIHAPLARSNLLLILSTFLFVYRFQYMLLLRGATSPPGV